MKIFTLTTLMLTFALSVNACAYQKVSIYNGKVIEFTSNANGFNTKTIFYEGKNEVIAFDAQFTPELARKSIEYLRKFTSKPISYLVITHPNPDKFNGASVFQNEGAKVVASRATKLAIPEVHAYKKYFFVKNSKIVFRRNISSNGKNR